MPSPEPPLSRSRRSTARATAALVLCTLTPPTRAAEPRPWTLARSMHFAVIGDASEKQLKLVAHQFEQLRGLLQSVSTLKVDSPRPIIVLAMRSEDSLLRLLPPSYSAKGRARPAGVFISGNDLHHAALRVDVGTTVAPYGVLYHEYVHLLNEINFPSLPLWLDEGLAEFYASADIDEQEARFGQIHPEHVLLLREVGGGLPLEKLLAVDHGSPEYTRAHHKGIFYAQSAALVHYFLMGNRGTHKAELTEYLRLRWQGVPESEAQQAFGGLARLEQAFASYVRGQQFFGMKLAVRLDPAAIVTAPLPEFESLGLQADFALHSGQLDRARELALQALKLEESGLARRVLGRVHAFAGRLDDAVVELERATVLEPMDPVAHYLLGSTVRPQEHPEQRVKRLRALERALELSPRYVPALGALARLLQVLGRPEEALRLAERAAQIEPQSTSWKLRQSSLLRALDRAAEANRLEAQLLAAAVSDRGVLMQSAWFLKSEDRRDEALALVAKARDGQPRHAGMQQTVGDLFVSFERADEAESAYRASLALQPDNASALNALGYLNADRSRNLPEALAQIEKALKLQPDDPSILDSRGWALFRLGRLEEAERDLRRALESAKSAVMLDHLGDVLAARGRRGEADGVWRQALDEVDATDQLKAALRAKLEATQATSPPNK